MRTSQLATRPVMLVAVPLLLAGVVAGVAPVTAAAARPGSPGPAASFTVSGILRGVAATSASNAWAVGFTGSGKTLILRWNGTSWKRVPSPAPAGGSLSGVAATSARSAWAVGCVNCFTGSGKTLILRWNGTSWKRVPSPAPAGSSLSGVAATSASSAWAVGSAGTKTLILRWNGKTWKLWKLVPSPKGSLSAAAAPSASSAWAVGTTVSGTGIHIRSATLILRWNGKAWKRLPSPSPEANLGLADFLGGVAVTSAGSVWAVGEISCGCGPGGSLIERWNGKVWKRVPSPTVGGGTNLSGVAAIPARSAWAVGVSGSGDGPTKTLVLRWNGKAWTHVPSSSPGAYAELSAVAVISADNAWAVGGTATSRLSSFKTLILHWNGKAWK